MSLFAALTTSVGGLAAQSSAIGNVSDNLANTQTTGFKSIDTHFSAMVTQSNEYINDPGGVRATPIYHNDYQGSLIQSQSTTSLAISGQGFFPVRAAIVNADGTTSIGMTPYFTRAGDFTLNKNGYLVNGSGYYLTGYDVNTDGEVDTSQTNAIKLSDLLDNPVSTDAISYSANLPAEADVLFESATSTIQIYDALGGTHDMTYTWTKTATNAWSLDVAVPDASYSATVPFVFNDTTNIGTIDSITTGAGYSVIDNSANPTNYAQISFNLSFLGAGTQTITSSFGVYDQSEGVTQFADANGAVSVSSFDQNGIPRGSFQSLSIDENGFVSLNYDNGRNRIITQIPIVQFFAQNLLQRVTGGAYLQTLASGTARYSSPGTNGSGTVVSNALEGSTVDIANEFTKLIQAQRVYSANARTVSTVDNMLQEVINIIR